MAPEKNSFKIAAFITDVVSIATLEKRQRIELYCFAGCRLNAVAVSGNDVYLTGNHSSSTAPFTKSVATSWKNGMPVWLTDGSNIANANGIAVSGNDVDIAGYEENGLNLTTYASQSITKYWKNGSSVTLSDSSRYTIATSIFLSRE